MLLCEGFGTIRSITKRKPLLKKKKNMYLYFEKIKISTNYFHHLCLTSFNINFSLETSPDS